jgi:hypothetical protein
MKQLVRAALAAVVALSLSAAPARAEADDDAPPIALLAPAGLAVGYIWAGRWERAVFVPLGVYTLVFCGAGAGLVASFARFDLWKPIDSVLNFAFMPLLGMGVAFGTSSALVLMDQAFLPHSGGPLLAPALSAGTVVAIIGSAVLIGRLHDKPEPVPQPPPPGP